MAPPPRKPRIICLRIDSTTLFGALLIAAAVALFMLAIGMTVENALQVAACHS
jgi:hypothetical protein